MSERLLSRVDGAALMNSEFGLKVTRNSFLCGEKKIALCGSEYAAPQPYSFSGRTALYREVDIRKWSKMLIKRRVR